MSARALLTALLAAAIAVGLIAAPATSAATGCQNAAASAGQVSKRALAKATLCLVNGERRQRGLRRLRLNGRLSQAAALHARDMARRDYFSHTSLSGESFVDRIRDTGYLRSAKAWSVGENIAWGSQQRSSPDVVVKAWMESPGHRANILGRYREMGIGIALGAPVAGPEQAATYATEFGRRR